ncbi:MAG: protein kinase domain-containing protein [Gemmataceae bacterium]
MSNETRLSDMLGRWEQLRTEGPPPALEELCAGCPELMPELKRRVAALAAMDRLLGAGAPSTESLATWVPDGAANETLPAAATSALRYRPLRLLARGGLGEVWVALDEDLQREVALKRIQPPHAQHPPTRRRFRLEAEATGRLEHPGIVPVYGLGQDDTGQLFYAMRLIQGETLQDAARRFHAADRLGHDAGARRLALRQLLGRFVAVCHALAYAHNRGVIHRDLKPANIMLGDFGETLVVDWGLAKVLSEEDEAAAPAAEPVADSTPAADGTRPGSTLGTPAYMSPEQAAGQPLGPATDVYSLGTTLYTLLTGLCPFEGRHVGEVVEKVLRGDCVPPRQRNPTAPRALEAVCLRAMARVPADRYPSAGELAAELERWLADEPVTAWREPWRVRARRWVGRHRTLVASGAATAVVALLALTAATLLLSRANDRERAARARAEANLLLARAAVDRYYTEVSEETLLKEPGFQPLRAKLLEAALDYYLGFLEQRQDDPAVRAELAETYFRVGRIRALLGQWDAALAGYQKARDLQEQLARERPDLAAQRAGLATTVFNLGYVRNMTGHRDEALVALKSCRDLRDQLVRDDPDNARFRNDLAAALNDLAATRHGAGQRAEAGDDWHRATDQQRRAVALAPEPAEYRRNLGLLTTNVALLEAEAGKSAQARDALREPIEIYERLVREVPGHAGYQGELAAVLGQLARLQLATNLPADAVQSHLRAHEIRQQLVRENPAVPSFLSGAAETCQDLGLLKNQLGQPADAVPWMRQARDQLEQLVKWRPEDRQFRQQLASTCNNLSVVQLDAKQPGDALDSLNRAGAIWEALRAAEPDNPRHHQHLGAVWNNRGRALARLDRTDEALAAFRQSIACGRVAADKAPGQEPYRRTLGDPYVGLAGLLRKLGRPAEAAAASLERARLLPNDPDELYDVARELALCVPLVGRGRPALTDAEQTERRRLADQAVEYLRQAIQHGYADAKPLENDSCWAPLRSREDFRLLVGQLKSPR